MKKLILLFALFAAVVLFSCSDDDSKNDNKYYVDQIVGLSDNADPLTINCSYNDKKQLVNITTSAGYIVAMTYEGDRLKTLVGNAVSCSFDYEGGVLSAMTSNGTTLPVVYDKNTRKYTIQDTEVVLNEYGDIIESEGITMDYDVSKKGPLASLGTTPNFMIGLLLSAQDIFTNRAITRHGDYQMINTYDSNGYVTKAVFPNGGPFTSATYSYKKL
jgi:hypothetical protein